MISLHSLTLVVDAPEGFVYTRWMDGCVSLSCSALRFHGGAEQNFSFYGVSGLVLVWKDGVHLHVLFGLVPPSARKLAGQIPILSIMAISISTLLLRTTAVLT